MDQDTQTREFVQLLTQNERRLYAYILSLVPRWADADDILQETNLRLWDEFDKYLPGTDFASWAMRMAFFQVMTFRKRHGRDRRLFSEQCMEDVAAIVADTNDEADALHLALADCMKKLSASSRDLLRACYSEGAKIKDVAVRLGRSVSATYQSISRLRITLHKCVNDTLQDKKEILE